MNLAEASNRKLYGPQKNPPSLAPSPPVIHLFDDVQADGVMVLRKIFVMLLAASSIIFCRLLRCVRPQCHMWVFRKKTKSEV